MEADLREGQTERYGIVEPGAAPAGEKKGSDTVSLGLEAKFAAIRESVRAGAVEAKQYSPLTLAYLGDAVYELLIRTAVVEAGNAPVNKLNRRASNLSKAAAQSEMAGYLLEHFTGEEMAVYKRGRNAHSYTKAKNASVRDYRRATGLEAVFGFLYLQGKMYRIHALINTGLAESGYPTDLKPCHKATESEQV